MVHFGLIPKHNIIFSNTFINVYIHHKMKSTTSTMEWWCRRANSCDHGQKKGLYISCSLSIELHCRFNHLSCIKPVVIINRQTTLKLAWNFTYLEWRDVSQCNTNPLDFRHSAIELQGGCPQYSPIPQPA